MLGKKKSQSVDKLTNQQKFGLKLIDSIANNLDKIAEEASQAPRSEYSLEVEKALFNLRDHLQPALDAVVLSNNFPFSDPDVQEVI